MKSILARFDHRLGAGLILACVTVVPLRASETIESHVNVTGSTYPALNFINGSTNLATLRVDVGNNIIDLGDLYGSAPSLGLRFYTNDVERLRITTDGGVGIGIAAPQAKLHVLGDLYISPGSGSQLVRAYGPSTGFQFTDEGSYVYLRPYHAVAGDKPLQIGPGAGGIRIAANGKVGIGTSSPSSFLHVAGGELRVTNSGGSPPWHSRLLLMGDDYRGLGIWLASNTGGSYAPWFAGRPYASQGFTIGYHASQPEYLANSKVYVSPSGDVGIGTTSPTHKLSVNGTIRAKEVIVEASPWPDDVVDAGYKLKALSEVAAHIEEHGHLPDVPSAAAVAEQGVSVGEMQATLLRKIEEMTLHLISHERRLAELELENAALRSQLARLNP